jgi:hypothetical protein
VPSRPCTMPSPLSNVSLCLLPPPLRSIRILVALTDSVESSCRLLMTHGSTLHSLQWRPLLFYCAFSQVFQMHELLASQYIAYSIQQYDKKVIVRKPRPCLAKGREHLATLLRHTNGLSATTCCRWTKIIGTLPKWKGAEKKDIPVVLVC